MRNHQFIRDDLIPNTLLEVVSIDNRVVLKILGNGSGVRIKDAKEQAAREGYEALRAIYPELNL